MSDNPGNFTFVKVENENKKVLIPISTDKPEIPVSIQEKWQRIIDLVARIMSVPTGLITKLTKENLEIFIASKSEGNPYKKDDKDTLGIGMFCETVAGRRHKVLVQDTGESDYWLNNPHAGLGMKSYLGVPIQWEDGELFGTFCMLDSRTSSFTSLYSELMIEFKEIIEADLRYILLNQELKKQLSEKELQIREIHHRIKNQFNLLINLINLQEKSGKNDVGEILSDLENRIRVLSVIHEKIYRNMENNNPELNEYISELVRLMVSSFSGADAELNFDIDKMNLSLNISVPIALIISELVSNSFKYAAAVNDKLKISIKIRETGKNQLDFVYRDNGPGYPENMDRHDGNLGVFLVETLTAQLSGEMNLSNDNGAVYHSVLSIL